MRLNLVHGFTQTSACWGPLPADLADTAEVIGLDAPGHGRASHERADLDEGAASLGGQGGTAAWLGYSMGGRYCLHLALAEPDRVERLVLVSTTAGIDDPGGRAARRATDEALAIRLEEVGVDAFLDEWLALPLFAGLPHEARCLEARRTNTVEGLASSLRRAGTGSQRPLWDRLHELAMPVLVVAGADDPKFAALAQRLVQGIGHRATLAIVDGAGHTVHLEQPGEFVEVVRRWLGLQSTGWHQSDAARPSASSPP